jgi:hypothetical protein
MWKLGGDRDAPTSRSMHSLCWDCRAQAERTADAARKASDPKAENEPGDTPLAIVMVA